MPTGPIRSSICNVCQSVCVSDVQSQCIFFRPLIGPQIILSIQGLSLLKSVLGGGDGDDYSDGKGGEGSDGDGRDGDGSDGDGSDRGSSVLDIVSSGRGQVQDLRLWETRVDPVL